MFYLDVKLYKLKIINMKNYLKTWKQKSQEFWQTVYSNAINGLNLQRQGRQNNVTDLAKRKRLHRKIRSRVTDPENYET